MLKLDELPVPTVVVRAKKAAEMARIWVADGDQVVTISPRLWDDPGAWGLMLVDFAKHVAKAYESRGMTPQDALAKIREAMDAEWRNPTEA